MKKQKRIYLQYKEANNDVVTVIFRSEKSLYKFLKNKKCKPLYISTERPPTPIGTKSQDFVLNQIDTYERLLCLIGGDT